jgi:hypothetical protein
VGRMAWDDTASHMAFGDRIVDENCGFDRLISAIPWLRWDL